MSSVCDARRWGWVAGPCREAVVGTPGKSPGARENVVAGSRRAAVAERRIFRAATKRDPRGQRPRLKRPRTTDGLDLFYAAGTIWRRGAAGEKK